jgi:hypothetical protein
MPNYANEPESSMNNLRGCITVNQCAIWPLLSIYKVSVGLRVPNTEEYEGAALRMIGVVIIWETDTGPSFAYLLI